MRKSADNEPAETGCNAILTAQSACWDQTPNQYDNAIMSDTIHHGTYQADKTNTLVCAQVNAVAMRRH